MMTVNGIMTEIAKRWEARAANRYSGRVTPAVARERNGECIAFMAGAVSGVRVIGVLPENEFAKLANLLWSLGEVPHAHAAVCLWAAGGLPD